MPKPSAYHPMRALIGWSLVFAALWSATLPWLEPLALEAMASQVRLQDILERFFGNPYQQALFILLGGGLIYLSWQLVALRLDIVTLRRRHPAGKLARLVGVMAGRGWHFWSQDFVNARGGTHPEHGSQYSRLPLHLLLWAFPMFGFLGTVYGLSGAVGQLSRIAGAETGLAADRLQPVFAELDIAFDTTIQGIVSAVVLAGLLLPLDIGWARLRQAA